MRARRHGRRNTTGRLKAWGFNTVATAHSESVRYRGLAHIIYLTMGSGFAREDALCPKTTWTGYPNVFSPDWPAFCDEYARVQCAPHRDDPWLIGYFIDNELECYGKSLMKLGLLQEAWKLGADNTAKRALVEFMKQRVAEPGDLSELFGVDVSSWDALGRETKPGLPQNDAARRIAEEWVRLVNEEYFSVRHGGHPPP